MVPFQTYYLNQNTIMVEVNHHLNTQTNLMQKHIDNSIVIKYQNNSLLAIGLY